MEGETVIVKLRQADIRKGSSITELPFCKTFYYNRLRFCAFAGDGAA